MLHSRPRSLHVSRQEWALIAITALWGGTFLVVHIAVTYSGPWFFVGLRFLVAGVISAVIFHKALSRMTRADVLAGAAIGVTIYLGYGLQTVGLQTIDSSMSAFITAFYVPLVPLLQWIILRKAPRAMTLVGVALAFVGLILIAGPSASGISLGEGELLTILSTVAIAAEIVLISLFAGRVSLARVTVVQLLVASLLAFATMPAVGEALPDFSWVWLVCGVSLGAASCLIQVTMNWAQRSVSPTRATVIYAAEPVWAGIIGRIAGERLGPLALLGAVFIVAGMLVSEITPRRPEPQGSSTPEESIPSRRD